MVRPAASAARRATLICAVVSGAFVWMSHPAGLVFSPNVRSAWVLSNLLGSEVSVGSFTIWTVGSHSVGARGAPPEAGLAEHRAPAAHDGAPLGSGAVTTRPLRSVFEVMMSTFVL